MRSLFFLFILVLLASCQSKTAQKLSQGDIFDFYSMKTIYFLEKTPQGYRVFTENGDISMNALKYEEARELLAQKSADDVNEQEEQTNVLINLLKRGITVNNVKMAVDNFGRYYVETPEAVLIEEAPYKEALKVFNKAIKGE